MKLVYLTCSTFAIPDIVIQVYSWYFQCHA